MTIVGRTASELPSLDPGDPNVAARWQANYISAMSQLDHSARRREIIRRYFRYVDSGDARILDLYTDDVELLFPKFGRTRGKDAMHTFGARMSAMLGRLEHDIDGLAFIESGDTIVIEGREWGEMADGTPFPDGEISNGLFCNVFEFEGDLIKAVRIYVDPDFPSSDRERIAALR